MVCTCLLVIKYPLAARTNSLEVEIQTYGKLGSHQSRSIHVKQESGPSKIARNNLVPFSRKAETLSLHTQPTSRLHKGSYQYSDPSLGLPCISVSSSSFSLRWGCIPGQESKEVPRASHPAGKAPAQAGLRTAARHRGQLLSPCPPFRSQLETQGEDVEAVSRFLPLPSTWQAVPPLPSPADIIEPHNCPTGCARWAQWRPLLKGTRGEQHKRDPPPLASFSGGKWRQAAAKCADLSSGSGPEGSPLPGTGSP